MDKLNGEESNGYNLNIEDGIYYISKKLKKLVDSGFDNLPVSILGSDDYDRETGEPTIDNPEENIFYLVPTGEDSDDMFEEWVYTNGKWEHFGAGGSVKVPQSDWAQMDSNATDYIRNKPAIKTGEGYYSILEGAGTTASGAASHAEGQGTTSSGTASHAEGQGTTASGEHQHVFGRYNINDISTPEEGETPVALNTYVEIVGNGNYNSTTREPTYSNARTLDWTGNEWLSGNLTAAGGSITIGSTTINEAQLQALLASLS